jgi:cyclopropane fatty-acyl-phospholipid synthase-like methyltransferase
MQNDDVCLASVAAFDRVADGYAEKYFHLDIYDRYLERFVQQIQLQGASVLDVACGPGNVSAYLARVRPDLELLGIDLAEGMVKQARQRVPSAQFLVKDCRHIDELERVFDAAAFAFGLSYLTDEDAERFFTVLNVCLADSAVLYLSTMTGYPSRSGFETASRGDKVYLRYRSVGDVISMVERAGYRVDFTAVIASPVNASKQTQDLILIAQRLGKSIDQSSPTS